MSHLVSFDTLVGANDSLKVSIQLAKAAILYPPRGLHTIIFGTTGTGKSLFLNVCTVLPLIQKP